MLISIIIRTYNEEKHLHELLEQIKAQQVSDFDVEVVLVDSGSIDNTLVIAEKHSVNIVHIDKKDFTFGRSLNIGCEAASGEYLVFVSGHCIPCDRNWLHNLVLPLMQGRFAYTYGRQVGQQDSKFSEKQLFKKYFPSSGQNISRQNIFCNNANAALSKKVWSDYLFDEKLTGLEDMALAKSIVADGHKVGYVANSSVYHIHEESWHQVRSRYEREAIALQNIMPEVQVSFADFIRYYTSSLLFDFGSAIQEKVFLKFFGQIVLFRLMQYWGTYRGNHDHRKMSEELKEEYFYPK